MGGSSPSILRPVSTSEEVGCIWRLSTGTALGPLRDGIPAAPRELLRDYVDKGFLGVKSGRGFYDYGD